jgi:uncharacterized iron-regulated membrane protein
MSSDIASKTQSWVDYRTIWRWHFYAGIFCIPFVIWLAITGSIYLFRPQIERWLDRPYDNLTITGPLASREAIIQTAVQAVPGSKLRDYQLPRTERSAVQLVLSKATDSFRVYVHPQTLNVLKVENDDERPMDIVFHLHGELLNGNWGSRLVELAGSWAIIMILSGLYLWWPRDSESLAGVLYPRLGKSKRIFWRDIHSVTGVWVSFFALFQLISGLPWAKSWGDYLKEVRKVTGTAVVQQAWPNGVPTTPPSAAAGAGMDMATMSGEHAAHMGHMQGDEISSSISYAGIDKMVATVASLNLPYPVFISPPSNAGAPWTARSDTPNRPLRVNLELDPASGKILKRTGFNDRHWVDRAVAVGIAAHEGQLFLFNQFFNLFMATGLIVLCISAVVMWWQRRPEKVLGAPPALVNRSPVPALLMVLIVAFGIYLPLMGVSLVVVLLTERLLLRRIPAARSWLGLAPTGA